MTDTATTAPSSPAWGATRGSQLDSLVAVRGIAAAGVFASHIAFLAPTLLPIKTREWSVFEFGAQGVSLFFALSGFVLAWTWTPRVDPPTFVRRRLARIMPMHVVVVAMTVVVAIIAGTTIDVVPTLVSLTLVHAWIPSLGWENAGNPVAWTLSCEAFFYVTFPALVWCLLRLGARGRTIAAVAIAGAGFVGTILLDRRGIWVSTLPMFRMWEFALGAIAAFELRSGRGRWLPPAWALTATLPILWLVRQEVPSLRGAGTATCGIVFTLLVYRLAVDETSHEPGAAPRRWWSSWAAQRGGEVSFAFYLVQLVPLSLYKAFADEPTTWAATVPLVVVWFAVTLGLAVALHELVEKPSFRALRGR